MAKEFDVVVVGGGPGGYTAAIRAAQLGLSVGLVERAELGGVCLNWGCIPTKALLHAAELKHLGESMADFGLSAAEIGVDLERVVKRSRQVAGRLAKGVASLMKKNGIEVLAGSARLREPGSVIVETEEGEVEVAAKNVVLATGARAKQLESVEAAGDAVMTYREAMVPRSLPESLLVIGAGAIGMEFASLYADLGTRVVVVEAVDRILPVEDGEISSLAAEAFEKRGIRIVTGATVSGLREDGAHWTATLDLGEGQEDPVTVDKILVAIGITGNVEGLGLEQTRVEVERGHVVVDDLLRTDEPGIWAIGDLVGPPWLAHKASHEGVICAEAIAGTGEARPLDRRRIPACTYSRPEVASIGLSEEAAAELGRPIRVGRFPFRANGKALAMDQRQGLVKTVVDDATGEILGAHLIGGGVTELIHSVAVAMTLEATEAELLETVFPHPTLSEMLHEAVLDAGGRAINK